MSHTDPTLPQFYERPEPMRAERHGSLMLDMRPRFDFAAGALSVPISAPEAPFAARHYPIVFASAGEMLPLAVLGLQTDENLFVDAAGRWMKGVYIPAYVRRYPFILASGGKDDEMTLCIDRASARVVEDERGSRAQAARFEPLFVDGKPSKATDDALSFCAAFERDIAETRRTVALMRRHGLFVKNGANMTLPNGATLQLRDFLAIDPKAVDSLSDEAFAELRHQGALPLLFAHLSSRVGFSELGGRLADAASAPRPR